MTTVTNFQAADHGITGKNTSNKETAIMTTQTIEQTEQVTRADLGRLTLSGQGERFITGVGVYSPAEMDEKKTQAIMEPAVQLPTPMSGQRLIARIARRIMAIEDWLSGPEQSERDCTFSAQVRARCDWTNYW